MKINFIVLSAAVFLSVSTLANETVPTHSKRFFGRRPSSAAGESEACKSYASGLAKLVIKDSYEEGGPQFDKKPEIIIESNTHTQVAYRIVWKLFGGCEVHTYRVKLDAQDDGGPGSCTFRSMELVSFKDGCK